MFIVYLVSTVLAASADGYAAYLNFTGAESVRVAADRVQVSHTWMIPFGTLLAAGTVGLLAGFVVPVLGVFAGVCLVLYFICAVGAHIRVHDHHIGGAVTFLVLAVVALAATLVHHDQHI